MVSMWSYLATAVRAKLISQAVVCRWNFNSLVNCGSSFTTLARLRQDERFCTCHNRKENHTLDYQSGTAG